ncbi:MAG: hypothetical protein ACE1Y2_00035 [Stenotrophomonas maltophilia]
MVGVACVTVDCASVGDWDGEIGGGKGVADPLVGSAVAQANERQAKAANMRRMPRFTFLKTFLNRIMG